MKTFETLRNHLNILGVLQTSTTRKRRIARIAVTCFLFGLSIIYFVTSFWFYLFAAQTTIESIESLFSTVCAIRNIVWYTICLWYRNEYATLFADLDAIIDRSMRKMDFHSLSYTLNNNKYLKKWIFFTVKYRSGHTRSRFDVPKARRHVNAFDYVPNIVASLRCIVCCSIDLAIHFNRIIIFRCRSTNLSRYVSTMQSIHIENVYFQFEMLYTKGIHSTSKRPLDIQHASSFRHWPTFSSICYSIRYWFWHLDFVNLLSDLH